MTRRETINHTEIAELSADLLDEESRRAILAMTKRISAIAQTNAWRSGYAGTVEPLRDQIALIDRAIGGIGINRLVVRTKDTYRGDYPEGDRGTYRTLSYALIWMLHTNNPRQSIQMSCEHLKEILKEQHHAYVHGIDHMPLGAIVRELDKNHHLEEGLIRKLTSVAHIQNIAKHDFDINAVQIADPLTPFDSQVFNTREALSMYFICRKLGVMLLSQGGSIE